MSCPEIAAVHTSCFANGKCGSETKSFSFRKNFDFAKSSCFVKLLPQCKISALKYFCARRKMPVSLWTYWEGTGVIHKMLLQQIPGRVWKKIFPNTLKCQGHRILCITSFSAFPTQLNQQVTSANLSEIGVMQRFHKAITLQKEPGAVMSARMGG